MIALLEEAQGILGLMQSFWVRNNPVGSLIKNIRQTVDYILNFSSHRKLMKYRSMVYIKQLQHMEANLWSGALMPEGEKLDRYY